MDTRRAPRIAPRWAGLTRQRARAGRGHDPVLAVLVYPTAWVLVASFKTPETMFSSGRHIYTLANYILLLS